MIHWIVYVFAFIITSAFAAGCVGVIYIATYCWAYKLGKKDRKTEVLNELFRTNED